MGGDEAVDVGAVIDRRIACGLLCGDVTRPIVFPLGERVTGAIGVEGQPLARLVVESALVKQGLGVREMSRDRAGGFVHIRPRDVVGRIVLEGTGDRVPAIGSVGNPLLLLDAAKIIVDLSGLRAGGLGDEFQVPTGGVVIVRRGQAGHFGDRVVQRDFGLEHPPAIVGPCHPSPGGVVLAFNVAQPVVVERRLLADVADSTGIDRL